MKIKGPNWKKQKSRRWLKKYRDQRKAPPTKNLPTFHSHNHSPPYLAPRSKIDLFLPLSKDQTPTPKRYHVTFYFRSQIITFDSLKPMHASLSITQRHPYKHVKVVAYFLISTISAFQTHHSNPHSLSYTISSQNLVTQFLTLKIKAAHALRLIKSCPFVISTQSLPPLKILYNPL